MLFQPVHMAMVLRTRYAITLEGHIPSYLLAVNDEVCSLASRGGDLATALTGAGTISQQWRSRLNTPGLSGRSSRGRESRRAAQIRAMIYVIKRHPPEIAGIIAVMAHRSDRRWQILITTRSIEAAEPVGAGGRMSIKARATHAY